MLCVLFLWVLNLVFINKNPLTTSAAYQQMIVEARFPDEFANSWVLPEPSTAPIIFVQSHELMDPSPEIG